MMTRRLIIAAIIGISCYAALFFLSARFNPVERWDYRLDRERAVTRAREVAASFGVDASNWREYVTADYQGTADYYLNIRRLPAPEDSRLTPAITKVLLVEPVRGVQKFRVNLTADGRIDSMDQRQDAEQADAARSSAIVIGTDGVERRESIATPENAAVKSETNTSDPAAAEAARGLARDALTRMLGATANQFVFVSEKSEKVGEREGLRLEWERSFPEAPELKVEASALVLDKAVREMSLTHEFTPEFRDQNRDRQFAAQGVVGTGVLFLVLTVITLPFFYFFGLLKRRIRHRPALILFGIIFLCALASNFLISFDESLIGRSLDSTRTSSLANATVGVIAESFFYSLGFALTWSIGFTFTRRVMPLRVASFVALLRGKVTTGFVGSSVASGVLLGGALAVVPLIVKASNLFQDFEIKRASPEIFTSIAPGVSALLQPFGLPLFMLYAFLAPALSSRLSSKPRLTIVVRVITLALGLIWLFDYVSRSSSGWSALFTAGILVLIVDTIFRRYDLLTLIVALVASEAASAAVSLFAVESPSLHASGRNVFLALGVVLVGATAVHFTGRRTEIETEIEVDPVDELAGELQAERERLVAEFGVARQAQQRMLPDHPPQIPGYEIAAVCRPAREVGGDLYDFLRLPDERIGIVVADVSGKGVPAALYMTLTKGLLASIAESETDPHRILSEVNRHLYEVCRRKVFVTLIFGVLDPATHTLQLARAGHNPTLWRRVRENGVRFLRAPGLGLGLNKGTLFERTLKIETIQLQHGDAVLFYSDGITEAMNVEREEYGEERLQTVVRETDGMNAKAIEQAILTDVYEFLDDQPPQDDITLVVMRVGNDG